MRIGHQASAAFHPFGCNSAGVENLGEGEKKDVPVKIIAANGTARMNGTRRRVEVVAGRVGVPGVG